MIQPYLKSKIQYMCSVLNDVTHVNLIVVTPTNQQDADEAKMRLSSSSERMVCGSVDKCGIVAKNDSSKPIYHWYRCPAYKTLKETQLLPDIRNAKLAEKRLELEKND